MLVNREIGGQEGRGDNYFPDLGEQALDIFGEVRMSCLSN